jgi:nickel transport protein
MKKSLIISTLFVLFYSTLAMAHSIRVDMTLKSPAVTIYAGFSKTKPIANAKVEIYAPEAETHYQTGKTDINGNFAFLPNTFGEWKIKIDDEMGHVRNTSISIPKEFFHSDDAEHETDINSISKVVQIETEEEIETHHHHSHTAITEIPLLYKAIFGLALIFGITGILYGYKANQKLKK